MITPRADAKAHGAGMKVDGLLDSDIGKTAVLIDDLVTRADSKLEAVSILTAQGLTVKDIVVLIDRKQGGREQLAAQGLDLHAALTMDKMLGFYVEVGRLSQERYQDTVDRLEALNRFFDKM